MTYIYRYLLDTLRVSIFEPDSIRLLFYEITIFAFVLLCLCYFACLYDDYVS